MFTFRQKPKYIEVLVVIWRPAWNAKSLCGDGYTGSSLAGLSKGMHHAMTSERRIHHPKTITFAKSDPGIVG